MDSHEEKSLLDILLRWEAQNILTRQDVRADPKAQADTLQQNPNPPQNPNPNHSSPPTIPNPKAAKRSPDPSEPIRSETEPNRSGKTVVPNQKQQQLPNCTGKQKGIANLRCSTPCKAIYSGSQSRQQTQCTAQVPPPKCLLTLGQFSTWPRVQHHGFFKFLQHYQLNLQGLRAFQFQHRTFWFIFFPQATSRIL